VKIDPPCPKNIRTGQPSPPHPDCGRLLWTAPNIEYVTDIVEYEDKHNQNCERFLPIYDPSPTTS